MSWRDLAACVGSDPGIWFADKGRSLKAAFAVCGSCPVADDCLEYALAGGYRLSEGVWGGVAPRARAKMRAERKRAASSA